MLLSDEEEDEALGAVVAKRLAKLQPEPAVEEEDFASEPSPVADAAPVLSRLKRKGSLGSGVSPKQRKRAASGSFGEARAPLLPGPQRFMYSHQNAKLNSPAPAPRSQLANDSTKTETPLRDDGDAPSRLRDGSDAEAEASDGDAQGEEAEGDAAEGDEDLGDGDGDDSENEEALLEKYIERGGKLSEVMGEDDSEAEAEEGALLDVASHGAQTPDHRPTLCSCGSLCNCARGIALESILYAMMMTAQPANSQASKRTTAGKAPTVKRCCLHSDVHSSLQRAASERPSSQAGPSCDRALPRIPSPLAVEGVKSGARAARAGAAEGAARRASATELPPLASRFIISSPLQLRSTHNLDSKAPASGMQAHPQKHFSPFCSSG